MASKEGRERRENLITLTYMSIRQTITLGHANNGVNKICPQAKERVLKYSLKLAIDTTFRGRFSYKKAHPNPNLKEIGRK